MPWMAIGSHAYAPCAVRMAGPRPPPDTSRRTVASALVTARAWVAIRGDKAPTRPWCRTRPRNRRCARPRPSSREATGCPRGGHLGAGTGEQSDALPGEHRVAVNREFFALGRAIARENGVRAARCDHDRSVQRPPPQPTRGTAQECERAHSMCERAQLTSALSASAPERIHNRRRYSERCHDTARASMAVVVTSAHLCRAARPPWRACRVVAPRFRWDGGAGRLAA